MSKFEHISRRVNVNDVLPEQPSRPRPLEAEKFVEWNAVQLLGYAVQELLVFNAFILVVRPSRLKARASAKAIRSWFGADRWRGYEALHRSAAEQTRIAFAEHAPSAATGLTTKMNALKTRSS